MIVRIKTPSQSIEELKSGDFTATATVVSIDREWETVRLESGDKILFVNLNQFPSDIPVSVNSKWSYRLYNNNYGGQSVYIYKRIHLPDIFRRYNIWVGKRKPDNSKPRSLSRLLERMKH